MNTIRILSDLHTEHAYYEPMPLSYFEHGINDINTILVLAGDIANGSMMPNYLGRLSYRFKAVVVVLGNHEYYQQDITSYATELNKKISHLKNVHLLHRGLVKIDDVVFVGATLWVNFKNNDPLVKYQAKRAINDYSRIFYNGDCYINPDDIYAEHIKDVNFIRESLKSLTGNERTVVVTHHAPTTLSINDAYKNSGDLNFLYVSDLSELIYETKPNIWIHGHTHSIVDTSLYDTRIICNPRGYPHDLVKEFDECKMIKFD